MSALALFVLGSGRAGPALSIERAPEKKWTIIPDGHPMQPAGQSDVFMQGLGDVEVISRNDAWAVGYYEQRSTALHRPAAVHWNGEYWTFIPVQLSGLGDSGFYDAAAISPTDVWAVGSSADDIDTTRTVAEHFDGRSWTRVPTQDPTDRAALYAVGAVASDDVWAAGTQSVGPDKFRTLIEHWNGKSWKIVPSPNRMSGRSHNELKSVAAISSRDVWVVGAAYGYGPTGTARAIIEHRDGKSWSLVNSPDIGYSELHGVTALSPRDIWAVGGYRSDPPIPGYALTEHWDGTRWRVVRAVSPASWDNALDGVAAVSPTQVWAVGVLSGGSGYRTLTERWNGQRWEAVSSPTLPVSSGAGYSLGSVAAIPHGGGLFGVGGFYNESAASNSLIERYGVPWCSDGVDNDHDGVADYPDDPGCTSTEDGSEIGTAQCDDGYDNDGDGTVDYRVDGTGDMECLTPRGPTEVVPT